MKRIMRRPRCKISKIAFGFLLMTILLCTALSYRWIQLTWSQTFINNGFLIWETDIHPKSEGMLFDRGAFAFITTTIPAASRKDLKSRGYEKHTAEVTSRMATSYDSKPYGPLLLVDINETNLTGLKPRKNTLGPHTVLDKIHLENHGNKSRISHRILWFNPPKWIHLERLNKLWKKCSYSNCEHTSDNNLIKQSSAVVFCISMPGLTGSPPLSPSERPDKQVWILFGLESPASQVVMYDGYIPEWNNSMNWSVSYRLDSDIVIPYGYLESRTHIPERNFSEIFRKKSKWAAWIVSKCSTPGLRDQFVEKLIQHGLPVDIYGRCGKPIERDPKSLIENNYKFYLSFENSMCSDYVTEKFFKYFTYDTIPVVRGGANYEKMLPKSTYINTANFRSYKDLVDYLIHVGNNETIYTEYLRNKEKYKSIGNVKDTHSPYCILCEKLNNLESNRKTYAKVPTYLDTCYAPDDIEIWK